MLKALMVITALSGDYTVPMESMEQCLKSKEAVLAQDKEVTVLCLPRADRHAEAHQKMENMFTLFLDVVTRLKEQESVYCQERPFDEECPVPSIR
tara:strand:+ start:93 stop:377 length:285 start_codon:yes stop_codon:yes gene_type:complete